MKRISPRVSIIVPMFNVEKYIETCIESILRQTLQDFELILIDDCSTDRTIEIVQRYDDSRIKLFKQIKNSGESDSRNFGLKVASGKYVYFMDHDDAIIPDTLEILYNAAEESQSEVVCMNALYETHSPDFSFDNPVDVSQMHILNATPRFFSTDLSERLQNEFINNHCSVTPWMKLHRRDFLVRNEILFPKTTREGDVLFYLAELCFAKKFRVIDACGYVYRAHQDNTMHAKTQKHLRESILSLPVAAKYIKWIFSSKNLISYLPESMRIRVEAYQIRHFFSTFIVPAYFGELELAELDQILDESIASIVPSNPELVRFLTDALSVYLFQLTTILKGEEI